MSRVGFCVAICQSGTKCERKAKHDYLCTQHYKKGMSESEKLDMENDIRKLKPFVKRMERKWKDKEKTLERKKYS